MELSEAPNEAEPPERLQANLLQGMLSPRVRAVQRGCVQMDRARANHCMVFLI
jgi:hypothetical protein